MNKKKKEIGRKAIQGRRGGKGRRAKRGRIIKEKEIRSLMKTYKKGKS